MIRVEGDGTERLHEVEMRDYVARAPDGRTFGPFESESWFLARERARRELECEQVEVVET